MINNIKRKLGAVRRHLDRVNKIRKANHSDVTALALTYVSRKQYSNKQPGRKTIYYYVVTINITSGYCQNASNAEADAYRMKLHLSTTSPPRCRGCNHWPGVTVTVPWTNWKSIGYGEPNDGAGGYTIGPVRFDYVKKVDNNTIQIEISNLWSEIYTLTATQLKDDNNNCPTAQSNALKLTLKP